MCDVGVASAKKTRKRGFDSSQVVQTLEDDSMLHSEGAVCYFRIVKLPPLELLQKTHKFPGPYLFKVVGDVASHFESRVVAAVREELQLPSDPAHTSRESASGQHCAVTIEVICDSAEQVLRVYHRLSTLPGLVLML